MAIKNAFNEPLYTTAEELQKRKDAAAAATAVRNPKVPAPAGQPSPASVGGGGSQPPAVPRPLGYGAGEAIRSGVTAAAKTGLNLSAQGLDIGSAPIRAAGNALSNVTRGVMGAQPQTYSPTPFQDTLAGIKRAVTPGAVAAPAPAFGVLRNAAAAAGRLASGTVAAATQTPPAPAVQRLPTLTTQPGQTTVDRVDLPGGRSLNYGAMVNGVPTFSDGTGGIPRTMSEARIANPAPGRLTVLPAGAGAPAFDGRGNFVASTPDPVGASRTDGGARAASSTPVVPAGPGAASAPPLAGSAAPAAPGISRPGVDPVQAAAAAAAADAIRAERNRQSDLASIASGDPRSAIGIAARNLRSQAQYSTDGLRRDAAAGQLATLTGEAAKGSGAQFSAGMNAELAQGAQREQGANARAALDANTSLQRSMIDRPQPATLTLDDGTLAQIGEGGVLRPLTVNGKPARAMQTRNEGALQAGDILKAYGDQLKSIRDAGIGGKPEELNAAIAQLNSSPLGQAYARILGGPGEPAAAGTKPTLQEFLAKARKLNPGASEQELAAYYEQNYGS